MCATVRIGITSALQPWEEPKEESAIAFHAAWLRQAGASPVVLAKGDETAAALSRDLDGVLFSGGFDVAPELYGGQPHLVPTFDSVRDEGERTLITEAYRYHVPILCICRGLQLANVAFGGTLIEDLPTELGDESPVQHRPHTTFGRSSFDYAHSVTVVEGTRLSELVQREHIWTNSWHHQAIRRLAAMFRVAAKADDDVIEAIEAVEPDRFFLGLQWHPEAQPDYELTSQRIYEGFVRACSVARKFLISSPVAGWVC